MMLTSTTPALHPQVLWSQRAETVTLVVNLQDAADTKIELTPKALHFAATSGGKAYAFDLDFYKEVSVDDSKRSVSPRSIVFVLSKADKTEGYWPKLVSGTKPNFVKTDFSRWKDEDEEDEAAEGEGNPFGNMNFQDFGGQGGNMMGNLPGMMGGMDMSALSGMGGMPGGNMMNMNMEELPLEGDSDDEEEAKEGVPTQE